MEKLNSGHFKSKIFEAFLHRRLFTQPPDEADGPQPNNHECVCHDTVPRLISVSLGLNSDGTSGFATKTNMKTLPMLFIASALAFSGCATGAKFSDYAAKLPPPKQGYGRIWIYREARYAGSAIAPSVAINGKTIGDLKAGGFLVADRPPGEYIVETVDVAHSHGCHISLTAQSNSYVRLTMIMGLWIGEFGLEEASPAVAEQELKQELMHLHANQ